MQIPFVGFFCAGQVSVCGIKDTVRSAKEILFPFPVWGRASWNRTVQGKRRERFTESKLEWGGFCKTVHMGVVSKRYSGMVRKSVVRMLAYAVLERMEETLAVPLNLAVVVGVTSELKSVVQTHELENVLKQLRRKLRSFIRKQYFWWMVFKNSGLAEHVGTVSSCRCLQCCRLR